MTVRAAAAGRMRRALPALAVALACLGAGCRGGAGPPTPPSAVASISSTAPPAAAAATFAADGARAEAGAPDEEAQECHRFTAGLDRFVFNRLQPILTEAAELLHAPPDSSDPAAAAAGLHEAAGRLEGLVDELDRMGVPPRRAADLLLSIRRGVLLYAAGFEKGGRGWESGDDGLIREAKNDVLEAAAELNSFFGLQLCG